MGRKSILSNFCNEVYEASARLNTHIIIHCNSPSSAINMYLIANENKYPMEIGEQGLM